MEDQEPFFLPPRYTIPSVEDVFRDNPVIRTSLVPQTTSSAFRVFNSVWVVILVVSAGFTNETLMPEIKETLRNSSLAKHLLLLLILYFTVDLGLQGEQNVGKSPLRKLATAAAILLLFVGFNQLNAKVAWVVIFLFLVAYALNQAAEHYSADDRLQERGEMLHLLGEWVVVALVVLIVIGAIFARASSSS